MESLKLINDKYESERTKMLDKITVIEENIKLKDEIVRLNKELKKYREMEKDTEDEYE